ncbi:MAG: glycosyl hydrolase family 18 protein [Bacteroidia bacterium]|nr:glycosyl hydrolase family 18 protein [Bacteroidia bacterium]MDW8236510.1 glycosyl hydrolase family 18 protein [Bacteroidia bacterium]
MEGMLWLVGVWLQVPISIHQIEAEAHRPYAHFTERQWDSINQYEPLPIPATARTANTCVLQKQVMGYHPYWAGTAFTSYPWNLLSTIVFFSYEVNPNTGSYTNPTVINTWRTTSLVPTAKANGTQVQLCATLFEAANIATFLGSSSARLRCIDSLIALITQRNADGINIDFEGMASAQRPAFVNFMQQLRDTLNRRRPSAKLSIALPAVDWSNAYDIAALSSICDQLFIMGYDYYWRGASQAGPTGLLHVGTRWGSRCNSRTIVDYLASGAARNKLILGVPYYGFRFPTTNNNIPSNTTGQGTSRTYAQAYSEAETHGFHWDPHSRSRYFMYQDGGQWYQTWWHDSLSLAWTYRTVLMQNIAGVGMWALSYDRPRMELWNALRDHFTNCAVVACQDTFFDMGGTHGNYFNRENWTWTLAPTGASQVTVTFQAFQLENGYDTLFIYNGPTTSAPLIGHYTGNSSPGIVTGTSGSLTFRYKSDNATNSTGWLATWQCAISTQPPTTLIQPIETWQGRNFSVSFADNDDGSIENRYICIADYSSGRWSAASSRGFAYEDFPGSALPPGWTASVGTWSVSGGLLSQTDASQGNTNLYLSLAQDDSGEWLYHWKMRMGGPGSNRRAGLHIFVSDPTQTQRGNSYLLWFRLDDDRVELYRITGNTLPSPQHQHPYDFSPNTWYDIKATFNPTTGVIRIWINNAFVTSWTDASPLTSGGHLSFRTGNAQVDFDELRVYKQRGSSYTVQVGASGDVRYESPTPDQPAARILSIVRDNSNLWSNPAFIDLKIDLTPPTSSLSASGWKTQDYTQSFNDQDALSGVSSRLFLPVYREAGTWRARRESGFLYEEFSVPSTAWSSGAGSWSASGGNLTQSDATSTNTAYHHPIQQTSSHFYRVRAQLSNTTGNRRWGFHLLADNPSQANRGNSYLIWLRYDSQDLQIYETINDVLHTRRTVPVSLAPNTFYLVEVLYDNGQIIVWLNGNLVAEWTDESPLSGGTHISLRTNQASVVWDFVEVWKERPSAEELISVGPSGMLAAQNPSPSGYAGVIFTRVMDGVRWLSPIEKDSVRVDWTPPSAPAEVRDGSGSDQDVTTSSTLTANWDASNDPHSGVTGYEIAIGTAPNNLDVLAWTGIIAGTSHSQTGLSLTSGTTYYFGVRAVNGAGLRGSATWSDGIQYDISAFSAGNLPSAGIRVYPNPTSGPLFIEVPPALLGKPALIIGIKGEVYKTLVLSQPRMEVSLEGLPNGILGLWVPGEAFVRVVWE